MGNCCAGSDDQGNTKTDVGRRSPKKGRKNKKAKKGGALTQNEFEGFTEEVQNEHKDDLWSNVSDFESDEETDEDDFPKDTVTLERKGHTKDLFKKEFMDKVIEYCPEEVRKIYKKMGPFQYR